MRRVGLPMSVKFLRSLSGGSPGTGSLEAASASWPNVAFFPSGPVMTPFSTLQSAGFTFHWFAAAWTSMARALAPTCRICSHEFDVLEEPPVIWMPNAVCT